MKLQSEFLELPDGSLHFLLSPREGLPVIFLHGANRLYQHAEIWLPFVDTLPPMVKPYLLDLPGHGKSPAPVKKDDFRSTHMSILLDFIRVKNISNFVITGRSYGGHLAVKLASLFPNRTVGLFLIAPAGANSAPRYLSSLKIPIQVLWAEDDPVISSSNASIFQQISDQIDCYIIPKTNRGIFAHNPEKIVPEVFLKLFHELIYRVLSTKSRDT
ncbi:MAG: alpha/beta fold hydrolase [Candidatus Hodarchaeales archaeon]